jgi:hypothetical protein
MSQGTAVVSTGLAWSAEETATLKTAITAAQNGGATVNQRGLARTLTAGPLGVKRSYSAIYIAIRRIVNAGKSGRWYGNTPVAPSTTI